MCDRFVKVELTMNLHLVFLINFRPVAVVFFWPAACGSIVNNFLAICDGYYKEYPNYFIDEVLTMLLDVTL